MRTLITQRESVDAHGEALDVLEARYTVYFTGLGIAVRPVSNFEPQLAKLLSEEPFDGLILTGGGDIPTRFYSRSHAGGTQPNRDRTEKQLIEFCIREKKPILAICRGMQYINGLWGGRVSALNGLKADRPVGKDHPVEMEGETWLVNQYHNDGIYAQDLAQGLVPLAVDLENQVVEAFTAEREQILALQWHPERPFSCKAAGRKTSELIRKFFRLGEDAG